jgi:deazaflavin-dependent oxidoreductase (nitroreductase family)
MIDNVPSSQIPKKYPHPVSVFQKAYLRIHNKLMQKLVPLTGPGPILKWVFKTPVLLYHLGLGRFVGKHILILMTTGCRSGRLRRTPVEYSYDAVRDIYAVMAGWGGHTDWVVNLRANDNLKVYARGKEFFARAIPMSDDEVAHYMMEIIELNPGARAIFSRWTALPQEPALENLLSAAASFPSFFLVSKK